MDDHNSGVGDNNETFFAVQRILEIMRLEFAGDRRPGRFLFGNPDDGPMPAEAMFPRKLIQPDVIKDRLQLLLSDGAKPKPLSQKHAVINLSGRHLGLVMDVGLHINVGGVRPDALGCSPMQVYRILEEPS